MDAKDIFQIVLGVFSIAAIVISSLVALRGARPKELVDDSTAAGNFQKLVLELQSEVKDLRDKMDGKQLKVHMTIEIDKAPIVDNWQWISTNDADTKRLPPQRKSGFGTR